jgi:aldehyde dehydrogenase (NAD+)
MKTITDNYVGGAWIASEATDRIEVINPATEQVIATVPAGGSADVDAAVAAARAAFESWSRTSPEQRSQYLAKIQRGLQERREEIARLVTTEVGMPYLQSLTWQADLPITNFGYYAELTASFEFDAGQVNNSVVVKEPIGVIGCITPWNYPLHQIALKVAPALAAGCTVVLKPSEVAPLTAYLLAEVIHEAGLPDGVFNLISGVGPVVGEAIASHPDIDMVSFTGSTRAGTRVAELAAPSVKKVALELGGKSANIILDDADLPAAIANAVANCYGNAGQTCTALTRMLVPRSMLPQVERLAKEIAESFITGDPFDEKTNLGPIVSSVQLGRVHALIDAGVAEGAKLLTGGTQPPHVQGYFVAPTVFSDVTPDMRVSREEIFGPVLSILAYDDEDQAVSMANNTDYGLAGGVWGGDPDHAMAVARRLRAGQIEVNGGKFNAAAPFGGYKRSGLGREGGIWGLEEYLEVKSIQL